MIKEADPAPASAFAFSKVIIGLWAIVIAGASAWAAHTNNQIEDLRKAVERIGLTREQTMQGHLRDYHLNQLTYRDITNLMERLIRIEEKIDRLEDLAEKTGIPK